MSLKQRSIGKIVLRGRTKSARARQIVRTRKIGGGKEGTVFEVQVLIQRGKRKRKLVLVEKSFLPYMDQRHRGALEQFETMQQLLRLNKEKRLGLHIIPNIRLKEEKGQRPTLIMTKVKGIIRMDELQPEEAKIVRQQISKEMRILREQGYNSNIDMWVCARDPVSKQAVAWIVDFGEIKKIKSN